MAIIRPDDPLRNTEGNIVRCGECGRPYTQCGPYACQYCRLCRLYGINPRKYLDDPEQPPGEPPETLRGSINRIVVHALNTGQAWTSWETVR